jgi:hypothetical protein
MTELPKMTPVASSSLAEVGHDNDTLYVVFVSGLVYRYFMVPQRVYEALLAAPSHGQYFNELVRDHFPSERLR